MTVAEFNELEKIMNESADEHGLCPSCFVIPIQPGDIYCDACSKDVCEYLARA